ncbi:hypothetical protein H0H87_004687 [Tephrocybe sp. NHM501043]|nr:hypothetical protein H0H87_004687 [Tephrocybe sp. NHM501043]
MSSHLLLGTHRVHTIQDDMESFVYVILYHALRYLGHNASLPVPVILAKIFDSEEIDNHGIVRGGIDKVYLFTDPNIILGYAFKFYSGPLNHWWKQMRLAVHEWHHHVDVEQLAKVETDDTKPDREDEEFAGAAGMVSKVFEHPFDLTKVRLQSQVLDQTARFKSPVDCLIKTWKGEGVRGLYRVRVL